MLIKNRRTKNVINAAPASSASQKVFVDPDAMRLDIMNLEGCILTEKAAITDHFTGFVVSGN